MAASDKTLDTTLAPATDALIGEAIAKAAISQGQAFLIDLLTQRADLAQANSAPNSYSVGFAINSVAAGGRFRYLYGGKGKNVTGLVPGGVYVLSPDMAGDVCLVDDLVTGDFVTVMFVATSATTIDMGNGPIRSGVAVTQDVT